MADKVTPDDKGKIRVLVYGTLKDGHSNHILMEEADATFIGYDSVTGPFRMFDLGAIPAVVDAPDFENVVRGELYSIDSEGLAALDMLEGHPNFYARRKLVTDVHNRRAWMYMLTSTNWLHEGSDIEADGLWHPSDHEKKFWKAA